MLRKAERCGGGGSSGKEREREREWEWECRVIAREGAAFRVPFLCFSRVQLVLQFALSFPALIQRKRFFVLRLLPLLPLSPRPRHTLLHPVCADLMSS